MGRGGTGEPGAGSHGQPGKGGTGEPGTKSHGGDLPLNGSGSTWTLPERLGSRTPRPGLTRTPVPGSPVAPRPGVTRGPGGPPCVHAPGSPVAPKEASLSILSVLYGVHFGGWRRQNSAKHPPVGVFSKEDGMVRHPHRPKVGQKIGPPRMMEKGQSHGVPPEGALRIKWMRMMAKCNMTESTVSRRPRPIRMGGFRRKSAPPPGPPCGNLMLVLLVHWCRDLDGTRRYAR